MAYFPASCDNNCKDCSQNKCGWCSFLDRLINTDAITATTINSYYYSATITENKEDKK